MKVIDIIADWMVEQVDQMITSDDQVKLLLLCTCVVVLAVALR